MSILPIKTDLSDLNEEQRRAVTSESKQLLVLAGAGSGKTKTLLQKIIFLIEESCSLFYVVFTCAKEKLNLITERGNESPFLREIPETFTVKTG